MPDKKGKNHTPKYLGSGSSKGKMKRKKKSRKTPVNKKATSKSGSVVDNVVVAKSN